VGVRVHKAGVNACSISMKCKVDLELHLGLDSLTM